MDISDGHTSGLSGLGRQPAIRDARADGSGGAGGTGAASPGGLKKNDVVTVTVPELHLGVPQALTLSPGEQKLFRVSVSSNETLRFELKGARAGDRIGLSWLDNQGQSRSDEALVAS